MVTVSALMLSLVLTQPTDRGTTDVEVDRTSLRVRALAGALAQVDWSGRGLAGGGGLRGEVGLLIADRVGISLELLAATTFTSFAGAGGVVIDVAVTDRLSIGVGVRLSAWPIISAPVLPFVGFMLPLRIAWSLRERTSEEAARNGLLFLLTGGPGLNALRISNTVPPVAVSVDLTVAWARW